MLNSFNKKLERKIPMKSGKATILYTVIAALFICSNSSAQQQQQESEKHRYAGFGIRLPGLQAGDFESRAFPPARIIFSLDPIEFFRVEAQYGFFSSSVEASDPTADETMLQGKSSVVTLGLMGMYPKGKARFIFGFRYGIGNYSQQYWESYPDEKVMENTGKVKTLSGVIGGEYMVARYFSIGCEFSISSMKDEYSSASSTNGPANSEAMLSEGNVVFKFYPF
jgi:hypothetical protein